MVVIPAAQSDQLNPGVSGHLGNTARPVFSFLKKKRKINPSTPWVGTGGDSSLWSWQALSSAESLCGLKLRILEPCYVQHCHTQSRNSLSQVSVAWVEEGNSHFLAVLSWNLASVTYSSRQYANILPFLGRKPFKLLANRMHLWFHHSVIVLVSLSSKMTLDSHNTTMTLTVLIRF